MIGENAGDEIRGEQIVLIFRKEGSRALVAQTSGHRATRLVVKGIPARAVIEKPWRRFTE